MTTYTTESGIAMPDRRKPEPQRDPQMIGCTSKGCVFHPNRRSGTTGICICPGERLTKSERAFLRNLMHDWHDEAAENDLLESINYD